MYKLVCIDLDGTLLNSYGQVSNKNKESIKKLINKKSQIFLLMILELNGGLLEL